MLLYLHQYKTICIFMFQFLVCSFFLCSLFSFSCGKLDYSHRKKQVQQDRNPVVNFLPEYSFNMLSMTEMITTKDLYLLSLRQKKEDKSLFIPNRSLTIGGMLRSEVLAAHTNTSGKFGYLARSPSDFTGDDATDARVRRGMLSWTGALTENITTFAQILFSDTVTFATHKQGSLQMRRAYALFGNLDDSPIYGFIGKKDVAFGDMSTLSPFTPSAVWHYFGALGEGLGFGFKNEKCNLVLTGLCGGRGMRVVDSHQKGKINNGALNFTLYAPLTNWSFNGGAGLLLGTIYNQSVAEHVDEDLFGPMNPAVDGFLNLSYSGFSVALEYAQTLKDWTVVGHEVIAFKAEVSQCFSRHDYDATFSFSYSEGIQGDKCDPFAFNKQAIFGFEYLLKNRSCSFGVEYVISRGFSPLINIATNSSQHVLQNSIVVFAILAF